MQPLPEFGFVRLCQIVGRAEVTQEQAAANRIAGKGPQRPRTAIAAVIPLSATAWWRGIKSGRYPRPIKQGKSTLWNVADIRALIESMHAADTNGDRGGR